MGGVESLAQVSVLRNVSFHVGTGIGSLLMGSLAAAAGFEDALVVITLYALVFFATSL